MRAALLLALAAALSPATLAQTRLASDFEIAQMREQIARSSGFVAQLSGRMNLGDLHLARGERRVADEQYAEALRLAQEDRVAARRESDMTRYATSTAYAGLAQAKLGRGGEAFALLEEAVRFTSDSPKTWNLYASAMTMLGQPQKGVAAAWTAVAIATAELQRAPSTGARLDLAIYQHSLASALIEAGHPADAEPLLRTIIETLQGPAFEGTRRTIERNESFEIYSTARGEPAAYLSVLNRAQLRLAALLEQRGDRGGAVEVYRRVLEQRTDDPTALAGLARLSTAADQARYFAAAFDANPFSLSLVRAYQRHLQRGAADAIDASTTGGQMRKALLHIHRGELRAAGALLDDLERRSPRNSTLQALRRELDRPAAIPAFLSRRQSGAISPSPEELHQLAMLLAREQLSPDHRAVLDAMTFVSPAVFTGSSRDAANTVLESGAIGTVRFRFPEPTVFAGSFDTARPLRLRYRILGVTEMDGADALLLEPLGVEAAR